MRRVPVPAARPFLPLLLPLLFAGCVSEPFSRPFTVYGQTSPDTLRGECQRAAFDDPAVKEELAKTAGSVNYASKAWMQRLDDAKRNAVQRCMLQRGGPAEGGGVELPRR